MSDNKNLSIMELKRLHDKVLKENHSLKLINHHLTVLVKSYDGLQITEFPPMTTLSNIKQLENEIGQAIQDADKGWNDVSELWNKYLIAKHIEQEKAPQIVSFKAGQIRTNGEYLEYWNNDELTFKFKDHYMFFKVLSELIGY